MNNIFSIHRFSSFLTDNFISVMPTAFWTTVMHHTEQVETCSFYIGHAYGIKAMNILLLGLKPGRAKSAIPMVFWTTAAHHTESRLKPALSVSAMPCLRHLGYE